jgi:hypothetical protein
MDNLKYIQKMSYLKHFEWYITIAQLINYTMCAYLYISNYLILFWIIFSLTILQEFSMAYKLHQLREELK